MKWSSISICVLALSAFVHTTLQAQPRENKKQEPWYVSAGAIHRVTLKPTTKYWRFEHLAINPAAAKQQMLKWRSEGITALEIFAPEEGGNSYDGLDAKDRFHLDPEVGSIADFRRLVELAHASGMRIVTFQNLGYSSVQGIQFQRAEQAVRQGSVTPQTSMFFWSKKADAPPPAPTDSYFFVRPSLPGYDPLKNEFWQWSDRAHAYYWTRWPGKDANGNAIHLPQYDWSGKAWPEQANRVVHFWMNTGIDGMILDAVNWYAGATWQKIDQNITDVIAGYGNKLSQPEGGGGFGDDPVAWVKEGNFTNIYDYGLGIWWKKDKQPLVSSVESGNPAILETALRAYHDRVVAAGGTLYFPVPKLDNPGDQTFAEALIAVSGDLPCYCDAVGGITAPANGIATLLKLKPTHPALYQNSLRRRIPTDDDPQIYAIERYAADNSERLLLVFDFSRASVHAVVDLGAIHGAKYVDVFTGATVPTVGHGLPVSLEGHAFAIYQIEGFQ